LEILVSQDIAAAAARADLISCATSAQSPVLSGRWLRDGVHVDLVGSFSPAAREADDDVVRAARIVVDTREGALTEAGDLLIPFASGALRPEQIAGELGELCRGQIAGREHRLQRTVFKSVGCALEDLVAAELTVARYR
jgi:ornithine cyclodeaminase